MVYDWFNRGSVPPETPADPPVDSEVQPDQSSAPQPSRNATSRRASV